MMLEYFGIRKTTEELCKEVKVVKDLGTFTPQWACYLMRNGFHTEVITQNPKLFTTRDRNKSRAHLRKVLEDRLKNAKSTLDRKAIQSYLDYLAAGGKLTVRIPDEHDIRGEIEQGRPLLAELTSNWLLGKRRSYNFHFNVVTGIDDSSIYVNDPIWDNAGGKQKYRIQDFLFAMYAASLGTPDEGALMKLRPKA
jgi:hypothetical protein